MKKFTRLLLVLFFAVSSLCAFPVATNETDSALTVYAASATPYGGTPLDVVQERIDFSYRTVDTYYNPYELPQYISSYTCGISAGGEIFGFYDRLYEELIPNHQGIIFRGKYLYGTQGSSVSKMYDELYVMMNATSDGVTIPGFISGVKAYASSKGRTASLDSAMKNNKLDSTQYKSAFKSDKLLSLFVDGFNIIVPGDIEEYDTYDYVTIYRNAGAHVMIAYGYKEISYFNEQNQCFRTDSYLYVNSGLSQPAFGLVRLNSHCTVDDGYITEVK